MKPTYKNTLLSKYTFHGHISDFLEFLEELRYPFYEWNGIVYKLNPESKWDKIPVADLSELDEIYEKYGE